jgi:YesN/AraC family two-component response regulator
MPGMPGTRVLREIKKIAPDLSVVILTGHSSKDVAIEALKGRADDYLEKPIKISKVMEVIEGMMKAKMLDVTQNADDTLGKIARIKYFIERNYHKKVSLEDAASLVCLSPKYLSRVFKQVTGEGFNEYKLKVKMAKAMEALHRSDCNIAQVAHELDYQNLESFIRIFKKLYHCTPKEYREGCLENDQRDTALELPSGSLGRGSEGPVAG